MCDRLILVLEPARVWSWTVAQVGRMCSWPPPEAHDLLTQMLEVGAESLPNSALRACWPVAFQTGLDTLHWQATTEHRISAQEAHSLDSPSLFAPTLGACERTLASEFQALSHPLIMRSYVAPELGPSVSCPGPSLSDSVLTVLQSFIMLATSLARPVGPCSSCCETSA